MIVFYAMGGGLGHLARARSVLRALGLDHAHTAVITASDHAREIAFGTNTGIIPVPRALGASPAKFGAWLKDALRALAPETVIVDAFPLGVLGELADHAVLPEARLLHVARLLRWDAYRTAFGGTPRRYDASFAVEALTPAHADFLAAHSLRVVPLVLEAAGSVQCEPDAPWIVSHSGPRAEVEVLQALAQRKAAESGERPRIVLRVPGAPPSGERCAALVTACGFNSMLEGAAFGGRHFFLPLPRRFDNQPLRAARRRRTLRECAR